MATGTMNYGDIGEMAGVHAEMTALKHAAPICKVSKFGQTKPMPKHKSQKIKFRRLVPLEKATVLTEGVAPAAEKMRYEFVEASLKQYGKVVELTDVVADTHECPVLQDASALLGENAQETYEAFMWGILQSGTNVVYADGVADRTSVNKPLTKSELEMVSRIMHRNKGKKITKMLASTAAYGSQSVEAAYIAFAHSDLEADIRALPGFTHVKDYGSRKVVDEDELGTWNNMRFIISPDLDPFEAAGGAHGGVVVSTDDTKSDVYSVVVIAEDAYGHVPLKGSKGARGVIHPMILNPNVPRHGDPLGQKGSAGWKSYFAGLILNDDWLVRIEVACSEL